MTETQAVLQAALALPEAERMVVVDSLLSSLAPVPAERTEEEWKAVSDRRFRELESGTVAALSWDEVQRRVQKRYEA